MSLDSVIVQYAGEKSERGDPRFKKILDEMWDLHQEKSHDYGFDGDFLSNLRATKDFGIEPWVGVIIRMNDKITRLKALIKKGSLKCESVQDTLKDISCYGALAHILYEESQQEKK